MSNINVCAPGKFDSKNNTCLSMDQLKEIASGYNRYVSKTHLLPNTDKKLVGGATLIKIIDDKPTLLSEIRKRFEKICGNDDICITQQAFMNEVVKEIYTDLTNDTFRPIGPDGSKDWLSSINIDEIMYQYEGVYPDFKFFGAVPLDCADYNFCAIHNIDFNQLHQKKIHRLGIIFNLDKYGEKGSHWVSLFADTNKGEIYFCDSAGKQPLENIVQIINQFMEQYEKRTHKKAIYQCNDNRYQRDKSECGIYSCNFIIRMLAGEKFNQVVARPLDFEEINSCRNQYFRNGNSKYPINPLCDP